MYYLTSAKLSGNPAASGWVQVHEFKPQDEEKLSKRGHLFAVVATNRHEEGVDSVAAGRELLARFHEEYFGNLEATPFNTLKGALEKVSREFSESWGDVEISAVAVVGDVVYSASGGGAHIAIFRNGMLAKILVSGKGNVVCASGYPKENDMLLLGTGGFFEEVEGGVLKAALEGLDPHSAVEAIAPIIHSSERSGNLGAVIIKFGKREVLAEGEAVSGEVEKKPWVAKIKSIAGKVPKVSLRGILRFVPQKGIFLRGAKDEDVSQSKKTTFTVGVVLLVLLIVSIGFGMRQAGVKREREKYEGAFLQAQQEFEESISLIGIDSTRSRELFLSAQKTTDEIMLLKITDSRVTKLAQDIKLREGEILGEYALEPEVFIDLSLLSSGLKGDVLAASSERVVVLDREGRKVVAVDIATKKTEVVSGPDSVENPVSVSVYDNRTFLLSSDGIFELKDPKAKVAEKTWEGDALFHLYAGNIYLLDKGSNAILRYQGASGEFSSGQSWLSSSTKADFSAVRDWTIDGSIWVLGGTGRISRFSLGSGQNFSLKGLGEEITGAKYIYTNEQLKNLYILDEVKSRIAVFDKEGNFVAQYKSDMISQAGGMAAFEGEGKIILLIGSKLYSIQIRHL